MPLVTAAVVWGVGILIRKPWAERKTAEASDGSATGMIVLSHGEVAEVVEALDEADKLIRKAVQKLQRAELLRLGR